MRRISFLGLCLGVWILPLAGATLEQLSFEELATKSTAIVRAKVLDSYADFRGPEIFTHWKIQVAQQWKGQATAEVLIPGGVARGYRQSVPGAPRLQVGKEYVLFLWTSRSGATYLTGWSQGVFELSNDSAGKRIARRAAAAESLVERGTWRPVKDDGVEMPYAQLIERISTTIGAEANR